MKDYQATFQDDAYVYPAEISDEAITVMAVGLFDRDRDRDRDNDLILILKILVQGNDGKIITNYIQAPADIYFPNVEYDTEEEWIKAEAARVIFDLLVSTTRLDPDGDDFFVIDSMSDGHTEMEECCYIGADGFLKYFFDRENICIDTESLKALKKNSWRRAIVWNQQFLKAGS